MLQLLDYVCCSAIYQMATIRDAFRHFEDNTCVRFKEVPTNQDVNTNHILVTEEGTGYVLKPCLHVCAFSVVKQQIECVVYSRAFDLS